MDPRTALTHVDHTLLKPEATKEEVITVMQAYLPNFEHIETGKSLDSKM